MTEQPERAMQPVDSTAGGPPLEQGSATIWERVSFSVQFLLAMGIGGVVLWYLSQDSTHNAGEHSHEVPQSIPAVMVAGHGRIEIRTGSTLERQLATTQLHWQTTTSPLLRVTGSVVASLRPVGEDETDLWQFNDPEVLGTFFEWNAAQLDIDFFSQQIELLEALTAAQVAAQQRIVERTERLVGAGTDSVADLEAARAELLEREITGRQAIREAQTELRRAQRNSAVLVRRLELAGLDPRMLVQEVTSDVDLVMADVPEEFKQRVKVGQLCEARFIGMRDQAFTGVVRSIGGVLSPERRSLRVLFYVDDPDDRLRPGMFAEIGLGTDPRQTLLMPAESLLHMGAQDFVLVQSTEQANQWQVVPVEIGDTRNGQIEILRGLQAGDTILSRGAMLLQPIATESLRNTPRELTLP